MLESTVGGKNTERTAREVGRQKPYQGKPDKPDKEIGFSPKLSPSISNRAPPAAFQADEFFGQNHILMSY